MSITTSRQQAPPWLLLTFSLTKKRASLRVTVWRKLKVFGALPFANSGYLLPNTPQNQERFEWLATTIRDGGGDASVVEVQSIDNMSRQQLIRRFSDARQQDYDAVLKEIREALTGTSESRRLITKLPRLRQKFQEIASIDFFNSSMKREVERLMNKAFDVGKRTQPDAKPAQISRKVYQRRTWVTRPRPGIDRVSSAWLIHKFIDSKAKFVFATQDALPAGAVPYDMYECGFGHSGEDCTFETLTKVFGIHDKRVRVIAEMVHDADLFDDKFGRKEGFGIDEIMKGWAAQGLSDRVLLERGMQLAEGLYQSLAK